MKLTIEQNEFANALKKAQGGVSHRATIPSLSCFLIKASDGVMTVTASDLDMEVVVTAQASVKVNGDTAIPAKTLLDFVSRAPKGSIVSIEVSDQKATVKAGRARAVIATLPAENFLQMATAEYADTINMQSHELADLFGKTSFAMSTEETRYYLNGVFLTVDDERMTAVATDGHRFARQYSQIRETFTPVIVPADTVNKLQIPDDGEVAVSISATKIRFAFDGYTVVSKVIDGQFPDYSRIIPWKGETSAEFRGADMKAAVDRVGAILDKTNSAVEFDVSQGGIKISGKSNANQIDDAIDANVSGPDVRIAFNSKYVTTAMQKLDGNAIMELVGAMTPAVIRDDANPDWMLVVMPMRG